MSWLKKLLGKTNTEIGQINKKHDEVILTNTQEEPSYKKYQAMKKLGDRALSSKQYEKAIEFYEKALEYFNIPNHPKYLAALESIKKARNELTFKSGEVQQKVYVQDGMIKPLKIYVRLYSNKQLPDDEWKGIVTKAFAASVDIDPLLKQVFSLAHKSCEFDFTWEYVPYYEKAFQNVVANHRQTFFESLTVSPNPKLCRLFASDVAFQVHERQAQGEVVTVVFGKKLA